MYPKIYNYICIYIHNTIIIYSHYIPSIWLPYFGDILEPLQLIIISIVSPFIFFQPMISPSYFWCIFLLIHLWSNSEKSQKSGIHPKAWLGGRGLRQMLGRFAWGKRFMVRLPAPMVLSRSQKYVSVWKNQFANVYVVFFKPRMFICPNDP